MIASARRPSALVLLMILIAAGLLAPGQTARAAAHRVRAQAVVHPIFRRAHRATDTTFSCQQPGGDVVCYAPKQIRAAYDIQRVLDRGITGKGRTIVIVDAYGDPNVATELAAFDQLFGLPDPKLTVIDPDGKPTFDPTDEEQVGWSGEIALDVQWAHAVAPGADIDLVVAKSSDDADILSATRYAVDHNLGDVISQSFGESEDCVDPTIARAQHRLFQRAAAKSITLIASSGDDGASQPNCDGTGLVKDVGSPAADPLVLAVGGTSLAADPATGSYGSETAWEGSGGGFSSQFAKPFYQQGVTPGRGRGVPDVSYDADPNTGVLVVWSQGLTGTDALGVYVFGGTSAGSPQWAGITALADQSAHRRIGWWNPVIYAVGRSVLGRVVDHDVTSGSNTVTDDTGSVIITGYRAHRGWDPVTGFGSPDVARLLAVVGGGSLL